MKSFQRPFTILCLAPFCLQNDTPSSFTPFKVDPMDMDGLLRQMKVSVPIPSLTSGVETQPRPLNFNRLKDFHPDNMVQNSSILRGYIEAKRFLNSQQIKKMTPEAIQRTLAKWPQLSSLSLSFQPPQKKHDRKGDKLNNILELVALPDEATPSGGSQISAADQVEAALNGQLTRIFSSPEYQSIEASWRGLHYMLNQRHRDQQVQFKILPVSRQTLIATLEALSELLPDDLPSAIIIDLPMDSTARDMALLDRMAQFAESLLVPTVTWIKPAFFHIGSWESLQRLPYIPHHLESPPYAKWRRLKSEATADWLSLTCNRFLIRFPYGDENPTRTLRFREPGYLWISPVWAVAALMVRSLSSTGWPTHIADAHRIRLEDLALTFGKKNLPIATEYLFTSDRIKQFAEAGIMPLSGQPRKDIAFLPAETTIGRFSLSYALMLSLVAQMILWCRDQLPASTAPGQFIPELERLISEYWQITGIPSPGVIEIISDSLDGNERTPITLSLTPSIKALSSADPIRLKFLW